MQTLILYIVTAALFLGLDMLGIRFLIRPLFDRHVGDLLASPPRLPAALAFYLAYVAGVVWFVSLPALRDGTPLAALWGGMALGLMCYGTYEMTNYATLSAWSLEQVIADCAWGAALTGFSAWIGVTAAQRLAG